ncbi:MAG TPA: hypothetical protein VF692_01835 [Pyrinomonadaceae bacterium]
MANTSGQSNASDTGDWSNNSNNKEMNSGANSSATENGLLESDNKGNEDGWRDSEPHIQKSETEGKGVNPGRTPGKAEGVEDAEERGNQ